MKSLPIRFGVISVVIGLAIFGCAEAWAEDWRLYAKTDLYECFYDSEYMVRSSQEIVRVWTKLVYTETGGGRDAKRVWGAL